MRALPAAQHVVQSRPGELGEATDLHLRHACGERLRSQVGDEAPLRAGGGTGVHARLPVLHKLGSDLVHDNIVKHLTRIVLYIA